ncbi:MAG: TonB-dependent receptor plug domain-containing protein, partial [Gemmatimonadetes bacterium]|nr:TonB-dependent receptor plug domain-containing protein [Gemmatimonadota bacterium]
MRPSLALLYASALCLLNCWPSSAADIVVRVFDASDQTPLPGATLAVLGTEFGGYANEEGYCRVEGLPPGQYDLLCSHIGYRSHTLRGVVPGEEGRVVALEPTAVEVPELVVSAARRSQTFAQAPISISVADAERIADHNAFSLTGPLRYVSGISQVGSQPVVRGSSGYSRGTGSRLLMLVDGFPMLSSDIGDIKWDAVPLQQVERVEVVKGAGSALYGT